MLKNTILALTALIVLGVGTAMAGDCNNERFYGTYTRVDAPTDVMGDGTIIHQYVWTLVLNSDGSAIQTWTGAPDYMINFGTGATNVGSWKCRADGKLVVTLLSANYAPVGPDGYIPSADISLSNSYRYTFLFKVNNPNQITRIQSRTRVYSPSENAADPASGTLGALSTTQVIYSRLTANDSDLTAP